MLELKEAQQEDIPLLTEIQKNSFNDEFNLNNREIFQLLNAKNLSIPIL